MTIIGRIARVPLREVWPHEAYDFTTWLQENTDVLSDAIGIDLQNVEREQAAGSFSVDLVGEDGNGHPVVIENQLEKSDHDHLGKVITYLAAFEARTAIWIVSDPRPEHVGAINWLNESAVDFYLLKVEAIKIADSPAAPLLTLITGPSVEAKQVGSAKREQSERHTLRHEFWASLLERATTRSRAHAHAGVSPGDDSWISAGSGMSGVHFIYVVVQRGLRVEVLFESRDAAVNTAAFDRLAQERAAIEQEFGGPLTWDRGEGKKKCVIGVTFSAGGYRNPIDEWPSIQDEAIEAMERLVRAFRPRVAQLRGALDVPVLPEAEDGAVRPTQQVPPR